MEGLPFFFINRYYCKNVQPVVMPTFNFDLSGPTGATDHGLTSKEMFFAFISVLACFSCCCCRLCSFSQQLHQHLCILLYLYFQCCVVLCFCSLLTNSVFACVFFVSEALKACPCNATAESNLKLQLRTGEASVCVCAGTNKWQETKMFARMKINEVCGI